MTHNFNSLWCDALNGRAQFEFDRFAMCHDDIRPEGPWLKVLLDEMERVGADVISTGVAIKDTRGLTSMGVGRLGTWDVRRFTIHEFHQMPETFSIYDTSRDPNDSYLAVNTGLWVCKFNDSWVEEFGGFRVGNIVMRTQKGFEAAFRPEDWEFGHWCHMRGLKVYATRKIKIWHTGFAEFGNQPEDSKWTIDEECQEYCEGGRSSLLRVCPDQMLH